MPAKNFKTAATHAVENVPCDIESIFVAGGTMGQIDLYDAVNDATGTPKLTIAAPFPGMTIPRMHYGTGVTLKLAAATEVLVQRRHLDW